MAKDTRGNDLGNVGAPIDGRLLLVPYDSANKITAEMIKPSVKEPTLPTAYKNDVAAVGLFASDGGGEDSRDGGDSTEYFQNGYKKKASGTLTTKYTIAEDSPLIREATLGKPDSDGVYHVSDIIQDTKWCAYAETVYDNGKIERRAAVVRITDNAPSSNSKGEDKTREITLEWVSDPMYDVDNTNVKYLAAFYDPKA